MQLPPHLVPCKSLSNLILTTFIVLLPNLTYATEKAIDHVRESNWKPVPFDINVKKLPPLYFGLDPKIFYSHLKIKYNLK